MRATYEFRVAYRREGRTGTQTRLFQTRQGARRLVVKLLDDDGRYGELVEIRIERRRVGPWDTFEVVL